MTAELLRAERRDVASFLAELDPDDWDRPSLCEGWSVRDVAAHLVGWDELLLYRNRVEQLRALTRFGWVYGSSLGNMATVNRRLDRRTADLDRAEILRRLADDDPSLRWLWDGVTPNVHLTEYVIHHQDMRRALGRPREIPADRLVAALDASLRLPGVRRQAGRDLRRRRWEASDVDWTRGDGPVVRAPGEEILLSLAGRPVPM